MQAGPETLISKKPSLPQLLLVQTVPPGWQQPGSVSGSQMMQSPELWPYPFYTLPILMDVNVERRSLLNILFVPCLGLSRIGVM